MGSSSNKKKQVSKVGQEPQLVSLPAAHHEAVFGDIEDVVSLGALLRPTLEASMKSLSSREHEMLKEYFADVEKALAIPHRSYRVRMERGLEAFAKTFVVSPCFRFIQNRLVDLVERSSEATLTDFSKMTLVVGMLVEENQKYLASRS